MNVARLSAFLLAALFVLPTAASAGTPRFCLLAKSYASKVKRLAPRVKSSLQKFKYLQSRFKIADRRAKNAQKKVVVYFNRVFKRGSKSIKRGTWRYYAREFSKIRTKVTLFKRTGISASKLSSSNFNVKKVFASLATTSTSNSRVKKAIQKMRRKKGGKLPSYIRQNFNKTVLRSLYQIYLFRQYLSALATARSLSKTAKILGERALKEGDFAKRNYRKLKSLVRKLKFYNARCKNALRLFKKFKNLKLRKRTSLDNPLTLRRCGVDEDAITADNVCLFGGCNAFDISDAESEANAGFAVVTLGAGFEGNFHTVSGDVANHTEFDNAANEATNTANSF